MFVNQVKWLVLEGPGAARPYDQKAVDRFFDEMASDASTDLALQPNWLEDRLLVTTSEPVRTFLGTGSPAGSSA